MSMFEKLFGSSSSPEPAPQQEDIQQDQPVNPADVQISNTELETKPEIPLDIQQHAREIGQQMESVQHNEISSREQEFIDQNGAVSNYIDPNIAGYDHAAQQRELQLNPQEMDTALQEAAAVFAKHDVTNPDSPTPTSNSDPNVLAQTAQAQEWDNAQNKVDELMDMPQSEFDKIFNNPNMNNIIHEQQHNKEQDKGMDMDMDM